jgi:hypothetical protein
MAFRPRFLALVEHGQLIFEPCYRALMRAYLEKFEGKQVEVVIGKEDKAISKNLRGYYWGVVVKTIAEHTGYSIDETHENLQAKFFIFYREDGTPYIKSTSKKSDWNSREFSEAIHNIKQWAQEFFATEEHPEGLYIPEAGEIDYGK